MPFVGGRVDFLATTARRVRVGFIEMMSCSLRDAGTLNRNFDLRGLSADANLLGRWSVVCLLSSHAGAQNVLIWPALPIMSNVMKRYKTMLHYKLCSTKSQELLLLNHSNHNQYNVG